MFYFLEKPKPSLFSFDKNMGPDTFPRALLPFPDIQLNNDGNKEEVFALNFYAGQWWNGNAVYGLPARGGDDNG